MSLKMVVSSIRFSLFAKPITFAWIFICGADNLFASSSIVAGKPKSAKIDGANSKDILRVSCIA